VDMFGEHDLEKTGARIKPTFVGGRACVGASFLWPRGLDAEGVFREAMLLPSSSSRDYLPGPRHSQGQACLRPHQSICPDP
jgi:hypothetical protein